MKKKKKDIEVQSSLYWKSYWKNSSRIRCAWFGHHFYDSLDTPPKRKRREWNYKDYDGYYRITQDEYRAIHRRRRREAKDFCRLVFCSNTDDDLLGPNVGYDIETNTWLVEEIDWLCHISDDIPYPIQKYNIWWW